MRRYDMLPNYHFEDSVNGIIEKPVEPDMRDYVIEGNCGKNLFDVNDFTYYKNAIDDLTYTDGIFEGTGAEGEGRVAYSSGQLSIYTKNRLPANNYYQISFKVKLLEQGKYDAGFRLYMGNNDTSSSYSAYSGDSTLTLGSWYTFKMSRYSSIDISRFTLRFNNNKVQVDMNSFMVEKITESDENNLLLCNRSNSNDTMSAVCVGNTITINGESTTNVGLQYDESDKFTLYNGHRYCLILKYISGEYTSGEFTLGVKASAGSWVAYRTIGIDEFNKGSIYFGGAINKVGDAEVSFSFVGSGTFNNLKFRYYLIDTTVEYEPYKAVGELSPNLIPYPYHDSPKTLNGITWTVNADGSIKINGTNTSTSVTTYYLYQDRANLVPGLNVGDTYTFSVDKESIPNGMRVALNYWDSTPKQYTGKVLSGATVKATGTVGENWVGMFTHVIVDAGATVDTTVKIQLEVGDTATDYVPYGKYKLPVIVGGKNELAFSSEALTFTRFIDKKADIPAGRYLLSWSSCVLGGDSSPVFRFHANNVVKWLIKTGGCHLVTLTQPENRTMMYSNGYDYAKSEGITSTVNQLMLQDITDLPNLITYPYNSTTKTVNGVTFTDNGDGSITVNGTATGTTNISILINKIGATKEKYALFGCPMGGSSTTYCMVCDVKNSTFLTYMLDVGEGGYKDLSSYDADYIYVYVRISPNTTVENLVFKPKLVKVSTDYEPYITPTTTNIIRDNPLKPGESISCRADKLPSVTLKKNVTNTVKVDTEIQPKSVKCQYYTY